MGRADVENNVSGSGVKDDIKILNFKMYAN